MSENDKETTIEILSKRSSHNNVRICYKKVGNHFFYLILNCFLTEGEIKEEIQQNLNNNYVKSLFANKNEVIFLED